MSAARPPAIPAGSAKAWSQARSGATTETNQQSLFASDTSESLERTNLGLGNVLSLSLCLLGEPASKANSRRLVSLGGKPRSIKSKKALDYVKDAQAQAKLQMDGYSPMIGRLEATIDIHYASERPDLDESLILDLLQGIAYLNDRQVRRRITTHHIDRNCPRTYVRLVRMPEPEGSGLRKRKKR